LTDNSAEILATLKALLEEVKLLRESFDSFTSEGMPLNTMVPGNELVASAVAACGMIAKADPRMTGQDLAARIEAAQQIGHMLTSANDRFQDSTRASRLDLLVERPA
jgi:hypothetical protein